MSVFMLLKSADRDTVGTEVAMRVVGTREPPAKMVIQIAVTGVATVQLQGRIARDAPWQDLGPPHVSSTVLHIEAIQFLRAVASDVAAKGSVTVWYVWGW
jgi:hypothetical protein